MNKIPEIIQGPAIIKHGANFYESKEDIAVKVTDETDEITTLSRGKIAERVKARKVEATFTPIKWTDYSALFAVLNIARGGRVFGATSTQTVIYGADGTCVTLPRSAITGIPSIGLAISKDKFSSFTITGVADPTSTASGWSKIVTIAEAPMPSLPTLVSGDLSNQAFIGVLCADSANVAAGDIAFDLEEGAEISFDLKLNDRSIDRLGLFDMTLDILVWAMISNAEREQYRKPEDMAELFIPAPNVEVLLEIKKELADGNKNMGISEEN